MCATQSNYLRDFLSAMTESWKKLKTSNVLPRFLCDRIEKDLLFELLSNNSLFVGQLYEDKSLALSAVI